MCVTFVSSYVCVFTCYGCVWCILSVGSRVYGRGAMYVCSCGVHRVCCSCVNMNACSNACCLVRSVCVYLRACVMRCKLSSLMSRHTYVYDAVVRVPN